MAVAMSRSERAERKRKVKEALKVMLMMADDDPEMHKFADRVSVLVHEYRDGKLYVGKEFPPKYEVRRAKSGNLWCRCPDFAFRQREGLEGATGLCKHLAYAACMDLEIPTTGENGV